MDVNRMAELRRNHEEARAAAMATLWPHDEHRRLVAIVEGFAAEIAEEFPPATEPLPPGPI